jgi:hypothetical protein
MTTPHCVFAKVAAAITGCASTDQSAVNAFYHKGLGSLSKGAQAIVSDFIVSHATEPTAADLVQLRIAVRKLTSARGDASKQPAKRGKPRRSYRPVKASRPTASGEKSGDKLVAYPMAHIEKS